MRMDKKIAKMKRDILNAALLEFSEYSYSSATINNISYRQDVSKGIIFHYYKSKEFLYMCCLSECYTAFANYLNENVPLESSSAEEGFEAYFAARFAFFDQNKIYQNIFQESILSPHPKLKEAIAELKAPLDEVNERIISALLEKVELRPDFTKADVFASLKMLYNFLKVQIEMTGEKATFARCEAGAKKAIKILLYGVAKTNNV